MSLLNLKGWKVANVKETDNDYRIDATYDDEPTACVKCGSTLGFYGHGHRAQKVMDVPSHGKRTGVTLDRKRYRCKDCKATFLQPVPQLHDTGSMTTRLVRYIQRQSLTKTFAAGAVHEALSAPGEPQPRSFALLLAKAALDAADANEDGGIVVWSDPYGDLYPPAIAAAGIPLERLLILRPPSPRDEAWAVAECLRCAAVVVVVAAPPKLTRVEARRLQLAAEKGGGVGLLMRPASADVYAAATRWRVAPSPGDDRVQRWDVQLVHGHGGQVGASVVLEMGRETRVMEVVLPAEVPAVVARDTSVGMRITA